MAKYWTNNHLVIPYIPSSYLTKLKIQDSCSGPVGRPVASETRGQQFESSHGKYFLRNICWRRLWLFLKWAIHFLFFLYFPSFLYSWHYTNVQYKFCWWLDLNCGPLVSEATALPTEPNHCPWQFGLPACSRLKASSIGCLSLEEEETISSKWSSKTT